MIIQITYIEKDAGSDRNRSLPVCFWWEYVGELLCVEVVLDLLGLEVGDEVGVLGNFCLTVFHEYVH